MSNEGLRGKVHSIPQIDETLTKEGFGADAKVVGDKIKECNEAIEKFTGYKAGEYEIPTMELWEEYRTTERFLGKPVYTKLIKAIYNNDIGNTGGSYNFAIEFSTPSVQHFVRYGGTVEKVGANGWPSMNPIPFFDDNGGYMGANYMNNGGLAMHIEKLVIPANTTIYIQVWYTKLGD